MRNRFRVASWRAALALIGLFALSCTGDGSPTDGGTPAEGERVVEFGDDCRAWRMDGEEDCTRLSLDECAAESRCEVYPALRLVADAECYEAIEICINSPPVTTTEPTNLLSPDGTCHNFSGGFGVPGWFGPDGQTNCCPEVVVCEDES